MSSMSTTGHARGAPGIGATWTSSAKDLVTTAINGCSRIWLTIGHGIGNEIYWPSTGQPQVRDIGFIVADRSGWTEVKRQNRYRITTPGPAVLAPTVTHEGDGWALRLDWIVDPDRDSVVVDYDLSGSATGLWVLVAPHLGGGGVANTAWVDTELHATADSGAASLAMAASEGFLEASAGFVGVSDGWQDFAANGTQEWRYDRAEHGNVAMLGRLPIAGALAVSIADNPDGATTLARTTLATGTDTVRGRFVSGWEEFASKLQTHDVDARWRPLVDTSAAVLACHEDRTYPGASVASLSIPWGNSRQDLGGYHLVWARDSVECALGRLAVGDRAGADRTLRWLAATQLEDGHWTQNARPDGTPFWTGVQLDEVALPILLAAAVGADPADPAIARMVAAGASYLVDNGPASPQDRWEEDAGTNAFTLAVMIAALVVARRWLAPDDADYCDRLADYWNARLEDWLYALGGDLCQGRDIDGYYVRLGSANEMSDVRGRVDVRNRGDLHVQPDRLVAADFLALVRFGLRAPDDPRVIDTVKLIDDLLAVELPTGVAYRRYNDDGYGEHKDGTPFDGRGIGHPWPLLSGERGHYEAQRGGDPTRYLESMLEMTGSGGLLPEQVWDGPPIRELYLEPGHPTGSAMPLAWAHAEFIKLATMSTRGHPIERLAEVHERYRAGSTAAQWFWRVDAPFTTMPARRTLVVDHPVPFAVVHSGGHAVSQPVGMGRHQLVLDTSRYPVEAEIRVDDRVLGIVAVASR